MFTFHNYYVLKLLRLETITLSDTTLSNINFVLCYVWSQYQQIFRDEVLEYKCMKEKEKTGESWYVSLCVRICGGEGETAGVRKVYGGQRRCNYTRPAPGGFGLSVA
jgi:hypothetical protein